MTRRILKFEMKKLRPVMLLVLLLGFFVMLYGLYCSDAEKKDNEIIIREYIKILENMEQDETTAYMEKEYGELGEIISGERKNEEDYSYGRISFDEFHEVNLQISAAKEKYAAAAEMLEKCRYFDRMREEGRKTEFFYDYGLSRFLSSYASGLMFIPLYFALLSLLMCLLDDILKCHDMISTSARGGKELLFRRIFILFILAVSATVLLFSMKAAMFFYKGYGKFSGMHICSIAGYGKYPAYMSIGNYLMITAVKNLPLCFAALILPCLIVTVVKKCKKIS